tara:strand:- start:1143 stop:1355 length:213 start_codon:yes stop_codon:yes gene_type:complete
MLYLLILYLFLFLTIWPLLDKYFVNDEGEGQHTENKNEPPDREEVQNYLRVTPHPHDVAILVERLVCKFI